MKAKQYLHFPCGNGSYVVADNLSKKLNIDMWAVGEPTSNIYIGENFPVFASHPQSSGKRFADLTKTELDSYVTKLKGALEDTGELKSEEVAIVHHGFALAHILSQYRPVVTYLHGTEMDILENNPPPHLENIIRSGITNSQRIIAITDIQKDKAEKLSLYPKSGQDIDVIHNGVDINRFYPRDYNNQTREQYGLDPNKKLVLFAGRLTPQKGIEYLITAFADSDFASGKQLAIVGSGTLDSALKTQANKEEVNATFIPALPQEELAKVMSSADVFAMPSRFEPFGLVCIEALASGTPVVASNVGILSQLISPPKGGYVFERTNDHKETAQLLKIALKYALAMDSTSLEKYVEEVRTNYSWEKCTSRIQEIVKDLI